MVERFPWRFVPGALTVVVIFAVAGEYCNAGASITLHLGALQSSVRIIRFYRSLMVQLVV